MIDIINLETVNNSLYYHNKTFSDPQLCQVVYSPDTTVSLRNFIELFAMKAVDHILYYHMDPCNNNWCQISSYFKITFTHNDDR